MEIKHMNAASGLISNSKEKGDGQGASQKQTHAQRVVTQGCTPGKGALREPAQKTLQGEKE